MRRYGKVDRNHDDVRRLFKAHGCQWLDLSSVGKGCPDALVCWGSRHRSQGKMFGGRLELVEVKDGAKTKSRRALTPAQVEFHRDWAVWTITDEASALELVRWLKR